MIKNESPDRGRYILAADRCAVRSAKRGPYPPLDVSSQLRLVLDADAQTRETGIGRPIAPAQRDDPLLELGRERTALLNCQQKVLERIRLARPLAQFLKLRRARTGTEDDSGAL